jgi:acetyl-CoA C-acetyltransferase
MSDAVIVSAARTAIGTAYKGSLKNTPAEELATTVLEETVRRSGLEPSRFGDVIFAESGYGGGDLARYAAVNAGLTTVSGQAVNRHCAGSLTAVGNAAANIMSGMEDAVVAGGVMSASTGPKLSQRVLGTVDEYNDGWMPPTHPDRALGLTREELDEWAFRSHQRAIAAIDAGKFIDEIVPLKVANADGDIVEFAVDEHPRRGSTLEKLASLRVLHPEIEGFNITAGNSSGVNDAASALALTSAELAKSEGLTAMATVRAWAALGIDPKDTGLGAIRVIPKVLSRAGINVADVALWEINEAFASVPVGACKELGIDEELVNFSGSGCSLGHPVAASGARMLTTLIYELRRRGGGIGVAAMCAGGGQAGAVIIEVP